MVLGFKKRAIKKRIETNGTRCHYCGCELNFTDPASPQYRTLDHKHPLSKGGKNRYYNVVLACHACNIAKGNMVYREFVELKRAKRK